MIYAVDEIARIVRPIAQRYGLRAVYLFGSYARGAATEDSDIDLLIDTTGTNIKSLLQVAAVYCELEEALVIGVRIERLKGFAISDDRLFDLNTIIADVF